MTTKTQTVANVDEPDDVQNQELKAQPFDKTKFLSSPLRRTWWRGYWWAFMIFVLLLIMVILLVLFLAIIPAVTRHTVRDANFELKDFEVSNPTESGFTVVGLQSIGSVPLSPTTESFLAKTYDITDNHLFTLSIPSFVGSLATIPKQDVTIVDKAAFGNFAAQLVQERQVSLRIVGSTKVKIASRTVPVSFNKILTLAGLSDFAIKVTNVTSTGNQTYANAAYTASYNDALVKLDLGPSAFDLMYQNVTIGTLLSSITLAPGANDLTARASANITGLGARPAELSQLKAALLAKSDVPVLVAGLSNAASSWAQQAIRAVRVETNLTTAQVLTTVEATYGAAFLGLLGLEG